MKQDKRKSGQRERGSSAATAIWEESRTSCAPPSTHLHVPLSQDLAGHQGGEKARALEPRWISIWYLHHPEKERKSERKYIWKRVSERKSLKNIFLLLFFPWGPLNAPTDADQRQQTLCWFLSDQFAAPCFRKCQHFPSSHLNCPIFCCCDFKARPHRI